MNSLSALALLGSAVLAAACASAKEASPARPAQVASDPQSERYVRSAEADVWHALGDEALDQIRAAATSILVRRSVSLPPMIEQPDGSWKPEGPHVSAVIRSANGWVHLTPAAAHPVDGLASRELDRLLARPELWSEPTVAGTGCTDPGGPTTVIRHHGRSRVSVQPCGSSGLNGQLAAIVMAGRITDWSGVPQDGRPAGIELQRFDESLMSYFRYSSGLRDPVHLAVRTRSEWEGMWRRITARHGNPQPAPQVDFDREMLLIAAYGTQATGGYTMVIDRVLDTPHGFEAHVRRISPGRRCGTTAALTSPVDIVRVPRTDQVHWLVNDVVSHCS